VGINTDDPKFLLDVSGGTINSNISNSSLNFRASNGFNQNFLGISSYLLSNDYNGLVQTSDSAIIFDGAMGSYGLCICPQNNSSAVDIGIRMTADGKIGVNKASPTVEMDVSGVIRASRYFHTMGSGSLATQSLSQGCYLSWNNSATTGETNFITSRGSGTGGFNFIDMSSNILNSNRTLMTITGFPSGGRLGIGITNPTCVLDVSGNARIGTTTSNIVFTPNWNAGGTGSGFWINMPTAGATGIGSGGSGVNPWIAYAAVNTNWFTNSLVGDICYRNTAGRLLFGTDSSNSGMVLSNNCLIFPTANTTGAYRLDVTGSARVTGTLTTGGLTSTGNFSAPNISCSTGTLTSLQINNEDTINTAFLNLINGDLGTRLNVKTQGTEIFNLYGTGRLVLTDSSGSIATSTTGSLVLKTTKVGGATSIVFPSSSDNGDDWAGIQYQSNWDSTEPTGQKGKLMIGIENNASEDEIWITSCGGSGKIKLEGNVEITGTLTNSRFGIREIRNFINFQPIAPALGVGYDCLINHAIDLKPTYLGQGKYKITFTNGKVPPNIYYSVSITGTFNDRADADSGVVYSVCKKGTGDFTITQKRVLDSDYLVLRDGDATGIPSIEVTVSY
jgi:hypothetical protein